MLHFLKIKQNIEKQDEVIKTPPKEKSDGETQSESNIKIEAKEDKKTSSVFENLILLPDNMVWEILRDSCFDKKGLIENVGFLQQEDSDIKSRRFWPHWNVKGWKEEIIKNLKENNIKISQEENDSIERTLINTDFVEPDVFLRFDEFDVIIEAKNYESKGQYQEQWDREITAYRYKSNFGNDKKVVFIAVGGNETYTRGTHATDFNTLQKNTVYKCSWQSLLENVSKHKGDLKQNDTNDNNIKSQLLRILDNIILAFNVNGVYTYKWLDYMADSIKNIKFDTINSTSIETTKNFYIMDKEMEKTNAEKALIDVRNAFRLLSVYQQSVLGIVFNIRDKTIFKGNNIVGKKDWYSNLIPHGSKDAELKVWDKMWGLDFLYGHFFEYYFGTLPKNGKTIEMSVFQVSDDGYFYATNKEKDNKVMPDKYKKSSDDSHSYIILNVSIYKDKNERIWLNDSSYNKEKQKDFLSAFLRGELKMKDGDNDCFMNDGKNFIIKKYDMKLFANEKSANENVIKDFNNIVKEATNGISILA